MQIKQESEEVQVALRNEIKEGKAYILCELETGKIEKFEIEIKKYMQKIIMIIKVC